MIVLTMLIVTSCSETLFDSFASEGEGEECVLTLPIECALPQDVVVTRSARTESEEKRLNDLQILIFSASTGKLKGYKHLASGNSQLSSTTYADGEGDYSPEEVTGILTTTGSSYVYAVANCATTDYNITVPSSLTSYINSSGVFQFEESEAQDGNYDFYLSDLQKLGFSRVSGEIGVNDGYFLMCGMIEESTGVAEAVNIETGDRKGNWKSGYYYEGKIKGIDSDSELNLIKLRRVVSKVKFDIEDTYTDANTTYEFTLESYDIYNIPTRGNLVQGETASETADYSSNVFERMTNQKPDQQTSDAYNGFIIYLPENMQKAKKSVTDIHQREANATDLDDEGNHIFTNAPDGGTYVVLHGTYEETVNGTSVKSGSTSYTIHLGNFTVDPNDYNNERNYYYTYTVHVQGVNKCIAEAKRTSDNNPGAEGFIYEYGHGRSYTLDSHYDYCVMRFYQDEIQTLIKNNTGYSFYVNAMKSDLSGMGETDRKVVVTSDGITEGSLNGVDTDWIRFLKGGTYSKTADHGGTDPGYTSLCQSNGYTNGVGTNVGLSIVELLKTLYNNAENNNFWTGSDSDGRYIDYVCYLDENFYPGLTWDKFTNCKSRNFYIADNVDESTDGRTVYATRAYDVYQKSIQTFYNRNMSSDITAYGCEVIDETSANKLNRDDKSSGSRDKWNGRTNMIADNSYSVGSTTWPSSISYMREACIKRNRDINHNNRIDSDELRWYTPTVTQYAGLWIGEEALSNDARLYSKSTSASNDKDTYYYQHYYTSTNGSRVYWAEEGMAVGNKYNQSDESYPYYMRCIRSLPSGENINGSKTYTGATDEPDRYYEVHNNISKSSPYSSYSIDMSSIDQTSTQSQTAELAYHHEREDGNKVANYFYIANDNLADYTYYSYPYTASQVYGSNASITCAGTNSKYTGWRIPNQRELTMMYIVKIMDGRYPNLPLNTETSYGTICKTHFSGNTDRSWRTFSNMSMDVASSSFYYIRCIKVGK